MPRFQAMIERANVVFASTNANPPPSGAFPQWDGKNATRLGEVLASPAVHIAMNTDDQKTANKMPPVLQEALKAAIRSNLEQAPPRYGMQFIWFPSVDWDLEMCSVPGVTLSTGQVTPGTVSVIIHSPVNPAKIPIP